MRDLDLLRRMLEQTRADNRHLQEQNRLLAQRLEAIETSTSWRLMVRVHKVVWRWRAFAHQSTAFVRMVIQRFRRLFAPTRPQVDSDLRETCLVPHWDHGHGLWTLRLDQARLRALRRAKTPEARLPGPYVIRPVVAVDPRRQRPLVIHVIPNVYVGGSTQLIIDLLEHLADRYDQEVVTAALWQSGRHTGMVTHHFPMPLDVTALADLLAAKRPAIVHLHYWGLTDDPWYAAAMAAIVRTPCKIVENINTPIAPLMHSRIDHYVYVSGYVREQFGGGADDPQTSSVIHPGIDLSRFDGPLAADAGDAVGMVYRLEPDKLREDSIQLFIEIARRRPRTRIYIIGGGSLFRSFVAQTEAAGVRANFHFTGYVPYEHLPEWYSKFAVFVAPVWQESFGQVSVFAMSKGQAVGGYKIGALPEILGYDDTFGEDTAEAAAKIIALLDDPARRQALGRRNRERAQTVFGVATMSKRYGEIYDCLLVPPI